MRPVDVEAALIAYLKPVLGVKVRTTVPSDQGTGSFVRFVRVRRIGGRRRNLGQEQPLVLVECWDLSETAALNLAQQAWAALDAADGEFLSPSVWVGDSSDALSSPVSNPDPDTAQPRYTFTANMVINLEESA